jgi:hypothetical protein
VHAPIPGGVHAPLRTPLLDIAGTVCQSAHTVQTTALRA